jgi:hypothetical protein
MRRGLKLCFATALSGHCLFAVTSAIGVASAIGTFTVNDARVEGNSNVFEGSQIKTGMASSQIYLKNGATLTLGTNSSAIVYKDRLVLQEGATKVDKMASYRLEAANYRLEASEPATQAVIRVKANVVEVAALNGSVDVMNREGGLLTRIGAGTASAFQKDNPPPAQTGASPAQTGASPGQTGATAGQSGATAETGASRKKKAALYVALGASLGGLGLAVDAILQPAPTSP